MLFILFPPRFVSSVRPCSARSRLSPSSKPSFLSCFSVACLFQAPDLLSNFSCCGISDSLRCFSSSPSCGLRSTLVLVFLPTSLGKYLSLHSYVFLPPLDCSFAPCFFVSVLTRLFRSFFLPSFPFSFFPFLF